MAATEGHEQVTLRILVDKEKNRVVFAEAKKDFVDVLLSFLTFPLGTIARLVSKDSNLQPVRVGSLSTLYESMENLDTEHFSTYTCKEMLLQPRNSMEAYCRNLKLNIDDTEAIEYFICGNWECSRKTSGSLLSSFKNVKCSCGRLMNQEITSTGMDVSGRGSKGYVQATATFIICNDLNVLPNNLGTSVALLRNLGVEDMDSIQEMTVNVSVKEVLDLLKCSLLSTTPLTDLFLRKKQFQNATKSQPINMSYSEICEEAAHNARQMMNVKVLIRKSNRKVLFAQVEEDFADFLFSFLTFPLGRVVHMLAGSSSLGSIDKLYESIANLSADRYLISQELKDTLVKPQLAPLFKFNNQILPIDDEACAPKYSCKSVCEGNGIYRGNLTAQSGYVRYAYQSVVSVPMTYVDPKSSTGETSSLQGFAKGPSLYLVTDDLVVTPMSSASGLLYMNKSNIPLNDVEERVVSIGLKEGLSILKASLISSSALTNGLNHVLNIVKEEK